MKTEWSSLFVHFHRSEYPFVERCLDWIKQTIYNHQEIVTPFLDPREQQILVQLISREPRLKYNREGGIHGAERCRIQLGLSEWIEYASPIPIAFLRISARSKKRLLHHQVLGSLLGLGIRRDQIGDLYPHADGCDVIVSGEMGSYIPFHLEKVGKERVRVEEIQRDQLIREEPKKSTKWVVLSSLRLDTVISEGYRLSRAQSSKLIRSGKCKVNFRITDKPDYLVEEGSLLSLRGYGRVSVDKIERRTKKGKWLVCLGVFPKTN